MSLAIMVCNPYRSRTKDQGTLESRDRPSRLLPRSQEVKYRISGHRPRTWINSTVLDHSPIKRRIGNSIRGPGS